jgi:hypothetical protein
MTIVMRVLIAVAVSAALLLAQGNTRSVQGTVTNAAGGAVDQAVVQLKDTKTLAIRSFITKQDGTYHFHGLSTDVDYELRADYQGTSSGNKTLSSFDSRKQAVIDLKLSKK